MATIARVARVPNPKYKRSGIKSYAFALNKYKFTPTQEGPFFVREITLPTKKRNRIYLLFSRLIKTKTDSKAPKQKILAKKASDGSTGEVTSEDVQNDSEYLSPVTIGTPGQTFNLDFDTGSSDLWIFSTKLPAATKKTAGTKHVFFDESKSSTFQSSSNTWKISYGDGSGASGTTGTDTVTLAGIAIKNQVIEEATQLSTEFASGEGDGLLGLAWPSINTVTPKQAATPVENMISQKLITNGLFTAHLGSWRDQSTAENPASFYTFGAIDPDVLSASNTSESDIYYTAVDNSQGFWQFPSTSATVAGKTVSRSGNSAIADTGTTLALVDDATCKAIYDAIPGATYDSSQQGYTFPQSTTPDQLPVVTFAVGDQQFAVPKEALAFADAGNGTYYGGIQSRGSMDFDILGDTFLKGIYAIFDQAGTRFGAVQRPDPTGSTIEVPSS